MSTLRRFSLILASVALRLSLFFGFSILALVLLVGNGDKIKAALDSTDAYDRVTDVVIESGRQQAAQTPTAVPFDDPEIQKIIKNSFASDALRSNTEGVVDSAYAWLEGEKPALAFQIDLTKNKELLAAGLSDYAINRLAALPACTSFPEQTNVFKLECQPVYLDVKQQRAVLYGAIINDKTFLKTPIITQADLPKDESGRTAVENLENAPGYFSLFKRAPIILLAIATGLMVYIVMLSRTKRQGLRKISSVIIGTGVALAIAPIVASFITPSFNKSIQNALNGGQQSAGAIMTDVSNQLYADLNSLLINIALQVVLVGVFMWVGLRLTRPTAPYRNVKKKSGLASSVGSAPHGKGVDINSVPIQTSERKIKSRKPSKIKSKYRKI